MLQKSDDFLIVAFQILDFQDTCPNLFCNHALDLDIDKLTHHPDNQIQQIRAKLNDESITPIATSSRVQQLIKQLNSGNEDFSTEKNFRKKNSEIRNEEMESEFKIYSIPRHLSMHSSTEKMVADQLNKNLKCKHCKIEFPDTLMYTIHSKDFDLK